MTNTTYQMSSDGGPDDLPRTLRREREAREQAAREQAARDRPQVHHGTAETLSIGDPYATPSDGEPLPATVRRFDVPFLHMAGFFLKAVLAAVPALILLGAILWGIGALLQKLFPWLVKMQILIWFPN